ncbi:hypothetical protein MUK42_19562 [Musa troglodytarum]|uniref:Uncharacterized protein n=1 Tax=Musa troglodytarum TaxID=320322 RepID=A0A9E7G4J4_9LILI|nr:hypothetical protein MUK42_19562 [Musa troglodytarum]
MCAELNLQGCSDVARAAGCGGRTTFARTSSTESSQRPRSRPSSSSMPSWETGKIATPLADDCMF